MKISRGSTIRRVSIQFDCYSFTSVIELLLSDRELFYAKRNRL